MQQSLIVVKGLRATRRDHTDLSSLRDALGIALDQRAFGPGRLLVAFAKPNGRFLGLAHTVRTAPPEEALDACIRYARDALIGRRPACAVAYHDESVADGDPPADIADRFARAQAVAAARDVHLVDWLACDDLLFRSFTLALHPGSEWWDGA